MSEHDMEHDDPLADLKPVARQGELTRKVLALGESIMAAKDRDNSWANIAKRLSERTNIDISPEHLRITMQRYANPDGTPKGKRIAKSKGKKNATRVRNAGVQIAASGSNVRQPATSPRPVSGEVGSVARIIIDKEATNHPDAFDKRAVPEDL